MPKISLPIRFVSTTSVAIEGTEGKSLVHHFPAGVKVLADCGLDGRVVGTVSVSSHNAQTGETLVVLDISDGGVLTERLNALYRSTDSPETLPRHGHSGPEDGGSLSEEVFALLMSNAGQPNGLASLDDNGEVEQRPAIAVLESAPGAIPLADTDGAFPAAWVRGLPEHLADDGNPHEVTAAQVGLGNVTNDAQVKSSERGIAGGVATLTMDGLTVQDPASATSTPGALKIVKTGVTNKIDDWVSDATASVKGKAALASVLEGVAGTDSAKIIHAAAARQAFISWMRDTIGKFPGVVPPTLNLFTPDATSDAVPIGTFARSTTGTRRGPTGLIETVAANLPRRNWNANGTLAGWLLEPEARTNAVLQNRDLTQSAWAKVGCTPLLDQTGITGAANSASSLAATAPNATCLQAITLASSARFQTAYIKRLVGVGAIYMTMDGGSTWTDITASLSSAAWTRLSIPTQTLANPSVGFKLAASGDAIAVDGVQNENGTTESSVIFTTTVPVARSADIWTVPVSAFPFNPAEGTFYFEVERLALTANARLLTISDNTYNSLFAFAAGNAVPGSLRFDVNVPGAVQAQLIYVTDTSPTSHRFVAAYKANDVAGCIDGGAVQTDTSATMPTVTTINIGTGPGGVNPQRCHVKHLAYFPIRISNATQQVMGL